MANKRSFFRRYRLVFQSSPMLLKCAVLATLVVSIVALSALGLGIQNTKASTDDLRQQAAELEQQNQELEQKNDQLGTVQSVMDIAGEELGMVDKDATVISIG